MVREIIKVNGGSRSKEDWKGLGSKTVRGWCNKVKDRCLLTYELEGGRKKRTGKKNTIET